MQLNTRVNKHILHLNKPYNGEPYQLEYISAFSLRGGSCPLTKETSSTFCLFVCFLEAFLYKQIKNNNDEYYENMTEFLYELDSRLHDDYED